MSNEQPDATRSDRRAPSQPHVLSLLTDARKMGIAAVRDMLTHMREAPDQPARVFFAALLGACFVSLLAFLAVPHLDTPLQVALYAFVIAIPFLVIAIMSPSVEFSAGMEESAEVVTTDFQRYGPALGTLVGTPAALVGVTAVVWHLSAGAAIVGWLAVLAAIFTIDVFAERDYIKRQQAKRSGPAGDETPQP